MARYKRDIVAKGPQSVLNGIQQGLVITTGEIRAADGSLEQHIPDHRQAIVGIKENYMSRRMPRAMQHIKSDVSNGDLVVLFKPTIRHEGTPPGQPELTGLFGDIGDQEIIIPMRSFNRALELFSQCRGTACVVKMAMGNQDFFDGDTVLFNGIEDSVDIPTGINDRAPHGLGAPQYGTVLRKCGNRNNGGI